jgi:hypothetical protein
VVDQLDTLAADGLIEAAKVEQRLAVGLQQREGGVMGGRHERWIS